MGNYYDNWLAESERIQQEVAAGPRVARGKDLQWVRTRQDFRSALMIAPETGFPTCGSLMMRAEIPVGWHTGVHRHGEEAIYVESGEGFLLLEGARYDFRPGTILHIPFHAAHQLVNTGSETVGYIAGLAWPLEAAVRMSQFEQLEDCGPNDAAWLAEVPAEESQSWAEDGRRIAMHREQHVLSGESKHGATYFLMGRSGHDNGFRASGVAISAIFVETPRSKSHSHAHPEAYLYALMGSGYSEIGGQHYEWEQGDAVHVPPGMLHHQHFNPSDGETRELRFEFGIRYWFVEQWQGYRTIDMHTHASSIDDEY